MRSTLFCGLLVICILNSCSTGSENKKTDAIKSIANPLVQEEVVQDTSNQQNVALSDCNNLAIISAIPKKETKKELYAAYVDSINIESQVNLLISEGYDSLILVSNEFIRPVVFDVSTSSVPSFTDPPIRIPIRLIEINKDEHKFDVRFGIALAETILRGVNLLGITFDLKYENYTHKDFVIPSANADFCSNNFIPAEQYSIHGYRNKYSSQNRTEEIQLLHKFENTSSITSAAVAYENAIELHYRKFTKNYNEDTFLHELGHTFGLSHSSCLCNDSAPAVNLCSSCDNVEIMSGEMRGINNISTVGRTNRYFLTVGQLWIALRSSLSVLKMNHQGQTANRQTFLNDPIVCLIADEVAKLGCRYEEFQSVSGYEGLLYEIYEMDDINNDNLRINPSEERNLEIIRNAILIENEIKNMDQYISLVRKYTNKYKMSYMDDFDFEVYRKNFEDNIEQKKNSIKGDVMDIEVSDFTKSISEQAQTELSKLLKVYAN